MTRDTLPVIAIEATGSLHRAWAAELERLHPGALRVFAPSETKAARVQLGSGRFKTDDRDCAPLTYLARHGAGRRHREESVFVEEPRAAVRYRQGLVADRKKAQQRLHDQLNVLVPGLSAPAGHGRALLVEGPTGQAVLACAVALPGRAPLTRLLIARSPGRLSKTTAEYWVHRWRDCLPPPPPLMARPLMSRTGGGQPHPDLVDGGLDHLPRAAVGVDGQLRADELDQISADEHGLVDLGRCGGQPAPIPQRPGRLLAGRAGCGQPVPVHPDTARILTPLLAQLCPGQLFGSGRAGGLLRGRQLCRRERCARVDDGQVIRPPTPATGQSGWTTPRCWPHPPRLGSTQPDQPRRMHVPGAQPHRGAGITLAVILPQPPTRITTVLRRPAARAASM